MILHYFLSDDTLEIREVMRPNSGRDAVPVFVKRAKLPKNGQAVYPPGVITQRTGNFEKYRIFIRLLSSF